MNQHYPIGTPGTPWSEPERQQWLAAQSVKRSYQDEVLDALEQIKTDFDVIQYSALSYDEERYPLFAVKSRGWSENKPIALITGGVHGYETSGVQGALRFLETNAAQYSKYMNIAVAPCISPWAYETINRWNPQAIDPNRSFTNNSSAEESAALMNFVASLLSTKKSLIDVHIDLHETTDTDNSEFRPALAARDGVSHDSWDIPDGFYLVGDTLNPCDDFQTAIIDQVRKVTHIAPADNEGRIIGEITSQFGVINYATKALGLCTGFSDARLNTTTEVYPDSPKVDDENCIQAQVVAVCAGLNYLLQA